MKKHWFLLLLVPFLLGTSSSTTKVKFHNGSLTTAKSQAAQEGKLYFVEFMASWCNPCLWMDETTFSDTELADYIHQNYVAVKVNIDDFDGYAYKQLYDIKMLPSFLIFNSKGELLDQYAESLSAARLLSILKKYNIPANRGAMVNIPFTGEEPMLDPQSVNASTLAEPEIPVVSYDITSLPTTPAAARPPGLPNVSNNVVEEVDIPNDYETPVTNFEAEESDEVIETNSGTEAASMAPGTGLFRFSVTPQHNKGFSLQTGVYAAYENVLLEAAKLENDFKEYPIIVHIAAINGKRVYRVMLGEFPQKRDAIQFKRQLERYGIDGVVKGLATL